MCISWTIKCLMLLMYGASMKFLKLGFRKERSTKTYFTLQRCQLLIVYGLPSKNKNLSGTDDMILFQCHLVCHKCHVGWSWIQPKSRLRSRRLFCLIHGTAELQNKVVGTTSINSLVELYPVTWQTHTNHTTLFVIQWKWGKQVTPQS